MIYEIKHVELKSIKVNNLQKIIFPHKFLFDSLTKEIEYFKENENVDIYGIFGCYFSIKKKMAVEKKDSKSYYGYYLENNPTDSHISSVLRDSKTLKITENNCYENDDIKVVFAEKGFVLCDNFRHINESEKYNKFNRTLLMFLLALSYNIKSEELSQSVSLAYKNKSYEDMSRLRDEIYAFDLECFFYNPVKHDRQQVY